MKQIIIASEQISSVYLQSINESDTSEAYVQWLNDPLINQYLETRFYQQNFQTVLAFIRNIMANPHEHLFTIRLKKNNKHIGNIKVGAINVHHNIGEVSLFIGDKNFWGKGIASQAIQLISRYSLEQLQLRKLCAGAYKTNIGSTKAFLNSGYQHDGELVDHYTFNGQPINLVQVCLFEHQLNLLPAIDTR